MNTPQSFRITFIQAPLGRPEPLIYPLGIVTLAGALPAHHAIQILDPNDGGIHQAKIRIEEFSPQVICLSIRNLDSQIRRDLFYYYLYLKSFVNDLRSWAPEAVIIAGGSGFSLFPERIMHDNPALDLGIFLEADILLPDLILHLDTPSAVRGVYYRAGGQVHFSGFPELPPGEKFGRPAYHLLNPDPYQANGGVGVQTKRGCPLNCVYCTYPHLNGRDLRMLPVDQVIDELKILKETYGVTEITFVDGVFNLPKSRTEAILHAMAENRLEIKWRGWFTEQGFDRPFAELCRDTGCPEFSFSPDGFSSETLVNLGKLTRKKDILRVYRIAKETPGIRVAFNFFWNPPGQTFCDWLRLITFALKCKLVLGKKAGGIIFGNPRIEPHTPLLSMAVRDGIIGSETDLLPDTSEDLEKLFYSNPGTKYLDRLYSVYEKLWRIKQRFRRG